MAKPKLPEKIDIQRIELMDSKMIYELVLTCNELIDYLKAKDENRDG